MRVLVTGSEGSLMRAVIPKLLQSGHDVVGVDNFFRYEKEERQRDYRFVEGDLTDAALVEDLVTDVDIVIQAAARIFGVGGFHRYPADILAHDLTLHQNILWSAHRAKVKKVVYISSSMVFERSDSYPSRESDLAEAKIPSTDYGLSKLVGERLSQAFAAQYGLPYTIWRPFNIITPYERAESEQGVSHVFADLIELIVRRRLNPVPILGDGHQVRCYTWLDDVAGTIATWSCDPATDNENYNVGNPEPVTVRELATMIYDEAQALGLLETTNKPLEFTTSEIFADDVRRRIPDISKAATQLGFAPTKNTRESIRECLRAAADQLSVVS